MKNKIVLSITGLWMFLATLQETGVLDLLPFQNENTNTWIKFIVAVLVALLNAKYFEPNRTGNPDPKPPKG